MKHSKAGEGGGGPTRRRLTRWLAGVAAAGAVAAGIYVAVPATAVTSTWIAVSAGTSHTCAIKADTTVWCWGSNDRGQLGLGDRTDRSSPTKVKEVGSNPGWFAISAGENFTCGIRDTDGSTPYDRGYLYCWGQNDHGQLSIGDFTDRNLPRRNGALAGNWVAVDLGRAHACGVRDNGTGQCWGANAEGQLGLGHTTDRNSPQTVQGGHSWQSISAGTDFSCGLNTSGARYCWGLNHTGQLGLEGDATSHTTPTLADTGWLALDAGNGTSCGFSINRRLYCWGTNTYAHAGVGDTLPHDETALVSTQKWATTSSGGYHACAIRTSGQLYCWGNNEAGQLGMGDQADRLTETELPSQTPLWSAVSAGFHHTCGIRADAKLYCWGYNARGQLGIGTSASKTTPTLVP